MVGVVIYRFKPLLSATITNYLPDGLWAFSFTLTLLSMNQRPTIEMILLMVFGGSLIIELLQYLNVVSGTFDWIDLLVYFLFSIFSVIVHRLFEFKSD